MAKLRKGISYSKKLERPYTRKSKYRAKSYIRAAPRSRVIRFEGGNVKKKFEYNVDLISKTDVQIRDNSMEAARQVSNRYLDRQLGKTEFFLKIRIYPHHILRENPLASGAGADRMSTGMKKSFGKNIGIAARVKKGQTILSIQVNEKDLTIARHAAKKFSHKMPCSCLVVSEKIVK